MRFSFSSKELASAAGTVRECMLNTMPSPSECGHAFSSEFTGKMGLLRPIKKRHWAQRVAAILLTLLLCGGAVLVVSPSARAAVFSWVREVYESSVVYKFFNETPTTALPDYQFQWTPEDYRVSSQLRDESSLTVIYENQVRHVAIFMYYLAGNGTEDYLFTDIPGEPVTVNGISGYYYPSGKEDEANDLIWIDEEQSIVFSVSAFAEKDVILHMAESTELLKPTN